MRSSALFVLLLTAFFATVLAQDDVAAPDVPAPDDVTPAVPDVPDTPTVPETPAVPDTPTVPDVPAADTPTTPVVPTVDAPTTPDSPTLPDVPTVAIPALPDVPAVAIPTLPAVPTVELPSVNIDVPILSAVTDVPTLNVLGLAVGSTTVLGLAIGPTAVDSTTTLPSSNVAPVATGDPPGAQYMAALPAKDLPPNGECVISSAPNGSCAAVTVNLNSLPAGPLTYFIHTYPIGSNGSCATAGGVLNPYHVPDGVVCNAAYPQDCMVGDLAGKHGFITGSGFSATYNDCYLSLLSSDPAFVGNRSLVIHDADGTTVACANFTIPGTPSSAQPATGGSVTTSTITSTVIATAAASTASPSVASSSAQPASGGAVSTGTITSVVIVKPASSTASPSVISTSATPVAGSAVSTGTITSVVVVKPAVTTASPSVTYTTVVVTQTVSGATQTALAPVSAASTSTITSATASPSVTYVTVIVTSTAVSGATQAVSGLVSGATDTVSSVVSGATTIASGVCGAQTQNPTTEITTTTMYAAADKAALGPGLGAVAFGLAVMVI
ncbi:hypothetical protein LTR36_000979 [Oleoguttula mirabilis]|uniref:Superoxide dismutase copper/zinc binding domain-containing protein n=1 Tax=Oleoguttula mirabilis TaxID=1507867 RepID=A0AAV9JPL5_9PEZI|nr:hypothetical protein LTR36_000979 [Oleoguttula mirabilis]